MRPVTSTDRRTRRLVIWLLIAVIVALAVAALTFESPWTGTRSTTSVQYVTVTWFSFEAVCSSTNPCSSETLSNATTPEQWPAGTVLDLTQIVGPPQATSISNISLASGPFKIASVRVFGLNSACGFGDTSLPVTNIPQGCDVEVQVGVQLPMNTYSGHILVEITP